MRSDTRTIQKSNHDISTFQLGRFWGLQRGIVWSADDFEKLDTFMQQIRILKWMGDYDAAFTRTAELNKFIRKTYNDHHPNTLCKINVEGVDADIGHNKIMSIGIVGIVQQLAMQSDRFYLWMSMGTSTTPERIGQKKLLAEEIRVSVQKDGSMAGRGSVWNHVANFGYGVRSDTYYEFGVHDADQEPEEPTDPISRLLARAVLPNGLEHTQNDTFITASHSTVWLVR